MFLLFHYFIYQAAVARLFSACFGSTLLWQTISNTHPTLLLFYCFRGLEPADISWRIGGWQPRGRAHSRTLITLGAFPSDNTSHYIGFWTASNILTAASLCVRCLLSVLPPLLTFCTKQVSQLLYPCVIWLLCFHYLNLPCSGNKTCYVLQGLWVVFYCQWIIAH